MDLLFSKINMATNTGTQMFMPLLFFFCAGLLVLLEGIGAVEPERFEAFFDCVFGSLYLEGLIASALRRHSAFWLVDETH
jgi:hypothetical protein